MTVTQMVDVPPNRRIILEVPPQIPAGKTIIAFTPASAIKERMSEAEEIELIKRNADRLNRETMDILSYQNWFSEPKVSDK